MGKFTNLEMHLEPETTLFQQEVDVILAVIDHIWFNHGLRPTKGTFILDGQKKGEEAYNIMRFDLQDGCWCNSDRITEELINGILSIPVPNSPYPIKPGYYQKGFCVSNGFYRAYDTDMPHAVVIDASFGRFIASFYGGPYDVDTECLSALAEVLAQLRKEDKELRRSADTIAADRLNKCDMRSCLAIEAASQRFGLCEHPALKAWKEWHDQAIQAGELTYFFE